MASPKKPKKALVMFVIAVVVAIALSLVAVGVTFFVITSSQANSTAATEKANLEAQKAKEEAERYKKLAQSQQNRPVEIEEIKELQALIDIEPGTMIKENMVATVKIKEEDATPGALEDEFEAIGKVATFPLKAGEVLTKAKVADKEAGPFVKEGMRAITIKIDPVGLVGGAVTPGSLVDVLVNVKFNDKMLTKTILQNISVLAVGGNTSAPASDSRNASGATQSSPPPAAGAGSITLAVTPSQAEMLAIANSEGTFHLTLRNEKDMQTAAVNGSTVNTLLTGSGGRSGKSRAIPNAPRFPISNTGAPILFSDTPGGGLPFPTGPQPSANQFTMTIYKGSQAEEKTFEIK
jgi:pilus assembly protein CpaB